MAYNHGPVSMNYGLLCGKVADYFGPLGFPGRNYGGSICICM